MSKFFNFFDKSKRYVDWFDMLKLFDIFDRFERSVDSIDMSNIEENAGAIVPQAVGQMGQVGDKCSMKNPDVF